MAASKNLILFTLAALYVPAFTAVCNSWPFPRHRNTKRNDAFLLQPIGNISPSEFEPGRIYSWRLSGTREMMQYEVVFRSEPQYCGGGLMTVDETFEATECKNKLVSPKKQSAKEATFNLMAPQCGCFAIVALVTDEDERSYSYFTEPEHKLLTNTCSKASSVKESETDSVLKEIFNSKTKSDVTASEFENENMMEEVKDRDLERERSYQMFLQRKKTYEQNRRKWRRRQELLSKFGPNADVESLDVETTITPQEEMPPIQITEAPSNENTFEESRIAKIFENKKERREFCCQIGKRSAIEVGETDRPSSKICSKLVQTSLSKLNKSQQRQCSVPFKRCCNQSFTRKGS